MFYTIYKITNKINGKIYIGKHQTKNPYDDYMGSGKNLARAKNKYGIENFIKEILFVFDNEKEMNEKEAELVSREFCLKEDTYNICPGGQGGWGYINSEPQIIEKRDKYEYKLAGRIAANEKIIEKYGSISTNSKYALKCASDKLKIKYDNDPIFKKELIEKRKKNNLEKYGVENVFQRKEIREKIKSKFLENKHSQGINNSQYGSMWITDGATSKKIKKDSSIPDGWNKGRIIK